MSGLEGARLQERGAGDDELQDGTVRGRSFDEVKAIEELPDPEYGIAELIWSDYCAHYAYKQESERARKLMFLPRMLTNASMHCSVLVRLVTGTPLYMTWIWRRLLISLHGSDVLPWTRIGPGLRMPHPVGLVFGYGVLGRNVVLQHHITLSSVTTNWNSGKPPGWFQIGDDVTVFTGAVLAGQVAVGDEAVIGANTVVTRDVPAGHIVTSRGTRPATEAERLGL